MTATTGINHNVLTSFISRKHLIVFTGNQCVRFWSSTAFLKNTSMSSKHYTEIHVAASEQKTDLQTCLILYLMSNSVVYFHHFFFSWWWTLWWGRPWKAKILVSVGTTADLQTWILQMISLCSITLMETNRLHGLGKKVGLRTNDGKTKTTTVGKQHVMPPITFDIQNIENMHRLQYLGSYMAEDGVEVDKE